MNPEVNQNNNPNKEETPVMDGTSLEKEQPMENPSAELKWGDGTTISTTVDSSYLYQDPTMNQNNTTETTSVSTQPEEMNSPVVENSSNVDNLSVNDTSAQTNVGENLVPNKIEKVNSPINGTIPVSSPVVQPEPVQPVSSNPLPKEEPPVDSGNVSSSETSTEDNSPRKASTFLLVLLFIFLLAFIFFLPDITNYINLARDKSKVTATPTPTATETPVPTKKPELLTSLDDIATAFNQNELVVNIVNQVEGTILEAKVENNTLNVTYQVPSQNINAIDRYDLKDGILSVTNANSVSAPILVEVISQLQGNTKNQTAAFFETTDPQFTIELNGIEIAYTEMKELNMKIDLTQKMKTFDSETSAITLNYLKERSDSLLGNDLYSVSEGNFYFMKSISDQKHYTLYLGEKSQLDESGYQSLLAIVEFYLGQEVEEFKKNYSSIVEEEQTIGNVVVSKNIDDETKEIFNRIGSYDILKIDITKE